MSSDINWRQLANIWNGPEGNALKDFLQDELNTAHSELTGELKGKNTFEQLLEARGKVVMVKKIQGTLERAADVAKHNEGSFFGKKKSSDN